MNLIAKFKIPEHSTGIVFDTTRSNTGVNKGAVTRVVQGIVMYLLQLAFCHHVSELRIKSYMFERQMMSHLDVTM